MICVGNTAQQWQRWAVEVCECCLRNLDLIYSHQLIDVFVKKVPADTHFFFSY